MAKPGQVIPVRNCARNRICRDRRSPHCCDCTHNENFTQLEHAIFQTVWNRNIQDLLNQAAIKLPGNLPAEVDFFFGLDITKKSQLPLHIWKW